MKTIQLLSTAALAATMFLTFPSDLRAEGKNKEGCGPGGKGPGMHGGYGLMKGLDLTEEQKKQVGEIMKESRGAIEPMAKSYMEQRKALRDLIQTVPPDEA